MSLRINDTAPNFTALTTHGVIDFHTVLSALGQEGLQLVGPEVFNDELLTKPLDEVAVLACTRTQRVIDECF